MLFATSYNEYQYVEITGELYYSSTKVGVMALQEGLQEYYR